MQASTLVASDAAGPAADAVPAVVLLDRDGTVVTAGAELVRSVESGPRDGWAAVTDHVLALSLVHCRTEAPLEPCDYLALTVLEARLPDGSGVGVQSVGEAVVQRAGAGVAGGAAGDAAYLEAERELARVAEEAARARGTD